MSESPAIPAHRTGAATRSGDSHLIDAKGELVNIDAEAREAAVKADKKPAKPARSVPTTPAPDGGAAD